MFFDVFCALCEKRGISVTKATVNMGLSRTIGTKWKKTGAIPNGDTLNTIANYFGVTTDYLLGYTPEAKYDVNKLKLQLWEARKNNAENDEQRVNAEKEINRLTFECDRLVAEIAEKKQTPSPQDKHEVSDEDIMFALWGDTSDISEEDLADVKRYAAFIRERKRKDD